MKSAAQRPRMWTGDVSISVMRRWHARACSATADTCTRRRSDKHSQLPDTYGALGKAVRVAVEFRILGDIEALVDGHRLDIGHARQRCVLVCLLVDVNRPVSTDQLIDRVWADEPPLKARNALAAYISRLRQLLDVADAVHISRGPGGYTLTADPLSIDLHLFRDLVSQARATDESVRFRGLVRACNTAVAWRAVRRSRHPVDERRASLAWGRAAFGDIGSQRRGARRWTAC